ncbi:MAG: hypothetical protein EWV44_08345 [Microcystis flos-aquae Mf_QC_C_20070823_S20T]|nr:MAG: hypothetical protein EWV65_08995 [Microcystis flos-aquae Ma_QC_C_20070823_S18D]TRV38505.1 MAG: hypothetical protein EWV44_08345 [Microcystis flos-aquae Mf_QC_C_20070823_S20T]
MRWFIGSLGQEPQRDKGHKNVPFGRTQFAPTLWTKSVTVGAQSLRPPIDWDIIPTQVPKLITQTIREPDPFSYYN